MVEQMQADLSAPRAAPAWNRSHRPAVTADASTEAPVTAPRLLAVMMVTLLIPGNFSFVGTQMSPNRALLLGLMPFMIWRWLKGTAGKANAADICMLSCVLWAGLSLTVNHGISTLPRSVIVCTEFFGAYLFGRLFVRNAADYRRFFVLLACGFAVLLPFALIELVTGHNLLRTLVGHVFNMPPRQSNLRPRLGLIRAQAIFDHPILYGLVASIAVANVLYIFRDRFVRSVQLAGLFVFSAFITLSSGPMIAIGIQLILTVWDRFLFFMRFKWVVLGFLAVMAMMLLKIGSQFHVLDFVIDHLMFNPQTAYGRVVNFEYGMAEVRRHPVFGIGLGDWIRPWDRAPTFDNFWLNHGMRFGMPSLAFLALAIGINCARILAQNTLTPREADYRAGYLIALAGLGLTLGTVYIWSVTAVTVFMYLGMGSWLYMKSQGERVDEAVRARRAAQARATARNPGSPSGRAAPVRPARAPGIPGGRPGERIPASRGTARHRAVPPRRHDGDV